LARLTAGALLLLAASRFIFDTFTWLFAEYSRHAAQSEIYLSPWDDIARLSVISLASIPLVLFCGIRLIRSKADPPSSLAFAADCAGFYCAAAFVQFLLPPMANPSAPLLDNMRDALGISALAGALGTYSGLAVWALLLRPALRQRAFVSVCMSAVLTTIACGWVLVHFSPNNPNVSFWFWVFNAPVSAFIGAAVFRAYASNVSPAHKGD
jgi:hypothetical protein